MGYRQILLGRTVWSLHFGISRPLQRGRERNPVNEMTPIHEVLSRIRWDAAFAAHRFVISYWDRVAGKVLHVDLREISWDADNPSFFDLTDEEGVAHSIPFHRVREVWQDGSLIWQRHPEHS